MRDKAYGLLAGCDVADGMNSGVLLCDGALGALVGNRIVRNALAGVDVRDGGEGMLLFALNCLPSTVCPQLTAAAKSFVGGTRSAATGTARLTPWTHSWLPC